MTPEAAPEPQRLPVIARADVVVLFLIVADMVLKPTGGDVAALTAKMAYRRTGLRDPPAPARRRDAGDAGQRVARRSLAVLAGA